MLSRRSFRPLLMRRQPSFMDGPAPTGSEASAAISATVAKARRNLLILVRSAIFRCRRDAKLSLCIKSSAMPSPTSGRSKVAFQFGDAVGDMQWRGNHDGHLPLQAEVRCDPTGSCLTPLLPGQDGTDKNELRLAPLTEFAPWTAYETLPALQFIDYEREVLRCIQIRDTPAFSRGAASTDSLSSSWAPCLKLETGSLRSRPRRVPRRARFILGSGPIDFSRRS